MASNRDSWRSTLTTVDETIVRWVTHIMVLVHAGLGAVIIVGGRQRFPDPSYTQLVDAVDGRVWIWGVTTTLAAMLIVTPIRRLHIAGLWLGMAWMAIWAAFFFAAAINHETSVATAMIAYGGFTLIDLALLTVCIAGGTSTGRLQADVLALQAAVSELRQFLESSNHDDPR